MVAKLATVLGLGLAGTWLGLVLGEGDGWWLGLGEGWLGDGEGDGLGLGDGFGEGDGFGDGLGEAAMLGSAVGASGSGEWPLLSMIRATPAQAPSRTEIMTAVGSRDGLPLCRGEEPCPGGPSPPPL